MKKKNEEGEKDEGDLQVHMKEKCVSTRPESKKKCTYM